MGTSCARPEYLQQGGGARENCRCVQAASTATPETHPVRPPLAQEEWPLLIVTPASLRLVWAEELERWLPGVQPGSIRIIEGHGDRLGSELPHITVRGGL